MFVLQVHYRFLRFVDIAVQLVLLIEFKLHISDIL